MDVIERAIGKVVFNPPEFMKPWNSCEGMRVPGTRAAVEGADVDMGVMASGWGLEVGLSFGRSEERTCLAGGQEY